MIINFYATDDDDASIAVLPVKQGVVTSTSTSF
jgi:hypothetical protein